MNDWTIASLAVAGVALALLIAELGTSLLN